MRITLLTAIICLLLGACSGPTRKGPPPKVKPRPVVAVKRVAKVVLGMSKNPYSVSFLP